MKVASDESGAPLKANDQLAATEEKTVISQRPAASPREFYQQMPLAELADILEGKMLDHFSVGQLIGGGGMGAVFRGVDKRLDRVVAIKVIPAAKRDPSMLRRFRLEAQAAARLDHPNIARVFYVGEADQWDYIVFEFIDGINIRDLVDLEGPLSVDDAVFYTRQIAEALQHAHERDVVHRDIKPSNILVTASGTAKLVDMGLARNTAPERSSQDHTASGITLGTFDYISPEQARNPRDADVRSDLYSLGCSLFFMLTGHPPFPEGTALQKLLNHGSLPPPDPRGWRDDLPDELCQILTKLMAKRPVDRYQKPIELVNDLLLLAELDGLTRSQGPTTFAILPTLAQPTLLETHLPWLVAMGVLLGSTLWLQSQTISSGFALPTVEFPSTTPQPVEPNFSTSPPTPLGFQSPQAVKSASGQNDNRSRAVGGGESLSGGDSRVGVDQLPPPPNASLVPQSTLFRAAADGNAGSEAGVAPVAGSMGLPGKANSPQYTEHSAGFAAAEPKLPEPTLALPSEPVQPGSATDSDGIAREAAAVAPLDPRSAANTLTPWFSHTSFGQADWLHLQSPVESLAVPGTDVPTNGLSSGVQVPTSGSEAGLSPRSTSSLEYSAPNNAATTGTDVSPSVPGRILVVSSAPPAGIDSEYWESSLYRAVQRIAQQPGLGVIEIRGSVWLDRPLTIGSRPDGSTELTRLVIRGGQGSNARIEVARGVWSSVPENAGVMVLQNSEVSIQGIQLQAVLNETKSVPRSIIQLTGKSMLEASDSLFTVQGDRPEATHLISIGESQLMPPSRLSSSVGISKATRVTFERCFIRGQTSLFKLSQAGVSDKDSIQIGIDDSLIAIDGQAVNLSSESGPGGVERIVRMFCQWSTFVCSGGFARLEYAGEDLPLVGLSRTAQACVFWSRPDAPHVSITGPSVDLQENPDLLFLQGANNAYDQQTRTLCQLSPMAYSARDLGFRVGQQEGWFVERGNERAIPWAQPSVRNNSLHEASFADYGLVPTHFVPGFAGSRDLRASRPAGSD